MKRTIILMAVLCIFYLPLSAQKVYKVKNVESNTYLGLDDGNLSAELPETDSQSLLWEFEDAGDNDFKIKNLSDGTKLNIEHNKLQSTRILEGWWSARWLLTKPEGSDNYRIGSKWKTELFINTENGIDCTTVQDGWESALWVLEEVDASMISSTPSQDGAASSSNHKDFLTRINAFRREKGLNLVKMDENLNLAAEVHSKDMATRDDISHKGSNGSSFGDRIRATNYGGSPKMENVAQVWSEDAETSFKGWVNSPGHNRNMSKPEITSIGFAIAKAASGKYYATLVGGVD